MQDSHDSAIEIMSPPTEHDEVALTTTRQEMPWNQSTTLLIEDYISTAGQRSKDHDTAAKRFKYLNVVSSIPGIILPLVVAGLGTHIPPTATSGVLIISGVASAINSFMGFGTKSKSHFEFSARYEEFANNFKRTLAIDPKYRNPCDVTTCSATNLFNRLLAGAPPL